MNQEQMNRTLFAPAIDFNKTILLDRIDYMLKDGPDEFTAEVCRLLNINRLPDLTENMVIEKIIPKNLPELRKWEEKKEYYQANAICFKTTAADIFTEKYRAFANTLEENNGPMITNMLNVLNEFFIDGLWFLSELERFTGIDEKQYYGRIDKNRTRHFITFYAGMLQMLHGQGSIYSNTYMDPQLAATLLRQLIEIRIRRGVGIIGGMGKDGGFEPIAMKHIFEAMKKEEAGIQIPVPLSNIWRIYKWANLFMHSALTDYVWKLHLSASYLNKLFLPDYTPGKWSISQGITIKEQSLSNIRAEIITSINRGSDYQLEEVTPECRIIK